MTRNKDHEDEQKSARERILDAAASLVKQGDKEAATTRAVAEAASVQVPTIYRLFGDKQGLLDALAEATYDKYIAQKLRAPVAKDPVDALSQGWDDYVAFGLLNPAIFNLQRSIYPQQPASTAIAGKVALGQKVARIAQAGRLRVSEERAVELIYATALGCIISILSKPPEERSDISETTRDMVLSQILTADHDEAGGSQDLTTLAITLRARLGETSPLSPGEHLLISELLLKIAGQPSR